MESGKISSHPKLIELIRTQSWYEMEQLGCSHLVVEEFSDFPARQYSIFFTYNSAKFTVYASNRTDPKDHSQPELIPTKDIEVVTASQLISSHSSNSSPVELLSKI